MSRTIQEIGHEAEVVGEAVLLGGEVVELGDL